MRPGPCATVKGLALEANGSLFAFECHANHAREAPPPQKKKTQNIFFECQGECTQQKSNGLFSLPSPPFGHSRVI